MHKSLAIATGVLASVLILAGGARPDEHRGEGRGEGGRESGFRGGPPAGYGERGGERGGGRGDPGERGGDRGEGRRYYGGETPRGYGGEPSRPRGEEYRYAQPAYPREYRPAPSYQEGYAPPARRPNSLGSGWREQQEEARSGVRQGQMAPLGNVIQGIGRRSAGRPLDAGIEYEGGRAVYRVRWLMSNGRRVDYMVDAATGRILSEH